MIRPSNGSGGKKNLNLDNVSGMTKVRHHNLINKTFSEMPVAARRTLFMAMAQINSRETIHPEELYVIKAKQYAEIANISKTLAYQQLKDAIEILQEQTITISHSQLLPPIPYGTQHLEDIKRKLGKISAEQETNIKKRSGYRKQNITSYCDYYEKEGFVAICFSPMMLPYLCALEKNFTTQRLLSAVRLPTNHSCALYQLIKQNTSEKKFMFFDITVENLKDELSLIKRDNKGNITDEKYKEYKDFKKTVLTPSLKAISNYTELQNVSFDVIERVNRKIHKIRISYKEIDSQNIPEKPKRKVKSKKDVEAIQQTSINGEIPDYVKEIPPIDYY